MEYLFINFSSGNQILDNEFCGINPTYTTQTILCQHEQHSDDFFGIIRYCVAYILLIFSNPLYSIFCILDFYRISIYG